MRLLDRRLLDLCLQYDLETFIERSFQTVAPGQQYLPNFHIKALAWHLEQCAKGKIKRLLVTLPPRNLKSICGSVAFPAWLLGRDPTARIICQLFSRTCRQARTRLSAGDGIAVV